MRTLSRIVFPLNLFCLRMANFAVVNLILQIFLVYFVCNENILASSFKVKRGNIDTFQNLDCLTNEAKCSYCRSYNADCPSSKCKSCDCVGSGYKFDTFGFVEGNATGRCMDTIEMTNFPGPKERMVIGPGELSYDGRLECMTVDYWDLDEDRSPLGTGVGRSTCLNRNKYNWIYTKDKHLITLDRLDCLTVGSDNKVTVSPCKASSKNQLWYCDANGTIYSQAGGGSLTNSASDFRLSTTGLQEWKSYDPEQGVVRGNICDKTFEYKGCYKWAEADSERPFLKNIDYSVSSRSGTTNKVLAPIFLENTECSINWQDSTYLKNSEPWQKVDKPDGGITVSNADGKTKGIDLKVSSSSHERWSGTVLKLQVKCSSATTSEQHCVLIKIYSVDDDDDDDDGADDDKSFQNGISIKYETSKPAKCNSYKISTIVLAVCLGIVLAGILAYVVIQGKCNRGKARNDIPLYAEDQQA